eukprot:Opistho-2@53604
MRARITRKLTRVTRPAIATLSKQHTLKTETSVENANLVQFKLVRTEGVCTSPHTHTHTNTTPALHNEVKWVDKGVSKRLDSSDDGSKAFSAVVCVVEEARHIPPY